MLMLPSRSFISTINNNEYFFVELRRNDIRPWTYFMHQQEYCRKQFIIYEFF